MKNHTNECEVVGTGNCTCTDTGRVRLASRQIAALERDNDHYLDKITQLYSENSELREDNRALAEYPWGHQWTYWFTAMVAGGAAMVGLIVGTWAFA